MNEMNSNTQYPTCCMTLVFPYETHQLSHPSILPLLSLHLTAPSTSVYSYSYTNLTSAHCCTLLVNEPLHIKLLIPMSFFLTTLCMCMIVLYSRNTLVCARPIRSIILLTTGSCCVSPTHVP